MIFVMVMVTAIVVLLVQVSMGKSPDLDPDLGSDPDHHMETLGEEGFGHQICLKICLIWEEVAAATATDVGVAVIIHLQVFHSL